MAKTDTSTKYLVFDNLRKNHKIKLSDEALDTIDEIYIMERKSSIFKVGMFRFINVFFATIFIIIFWILKGTRFSEWMFVGMMVVFWIYNLIHCWNNIVEYKKTKSNKLKHPINVGKN